MLDVRRLLVLREVAAHGSITAAAHAIKCSQSAVSQQMTALERELGLELLERNRDGSRLTRAGELLIEHAEAVLARLELAEATLEELRGAVTGSVRVAAFSTAAAAILPSAVERFTARHPQVTLTVAVDDERLVVRPIAEPPLSRRVLTATRSGSAAHPATRAMVEILHAVTAVPTQ